MKQQLVDNGIMFDDSSDTEAQNRFDNFISRFDKVLDSTFPVTLVLDDPAGNSYVQVKTKKTKMYRIYTEFPVNYGHNLSVLDGVEKYRKISLVVPQPIDILMCSFQGHLVN